MADLFRIRVDPVHLRFEFRFPDSSAARHPMSFDDRFSFRLARTSASF
jgi:hypothetical protein